ncbi:LLM class flavin-dependent oxidoreductase [Dysgonomonas sp. Marseille-Q5470]|uniref:LLM class flavin-dependent oxidoreductase n=1 Tax=Dysgonomonas sp. Marseille-Q5470 TaxID=3039494 RepID=UPI0024BC855A|nr:LLM class flavin-dependent oxidoreductase [Dysgonomonas sp. Marseille-Q5470]
MNNSISISLLDLGIVVEGQDIPDALKEIVYNAQHIESLGYKRIWIAEHHNTASASTAATAVLIGHIAERTTTLRVGSGGIMLPNHTPLAVSEQFGTLDILYPDRIDLGLGRAPGTDQLTAAALRRNNLSTTYHFPEDVKDLQQYFSKENSSSKVRAFPGEGRNVPIWILGSSTDSAYLAAELGLPYVFASHFAPALLLTAIDIYKNNFKPSVYHDKPYLMVGANVIVADTNEEATFLGTSLQQLIFGLITGNPTKLLPPVKKLPLAFFRSDVKQSLYNMLACTFCGDKEKVRIQIRDFMKKTGADELFITNYIYDKAARFRSFELLAQAMELKSST